MTFAYQRSYRGPLKAVIFDWAGTVVDYGSQAPVSVFIKLYESRGVPITLAEARGPMGTHKKVHIRQVSQLPSVVERWEAVHQRPPNEEDVEAMFQEAIKLQVACLPDYADPIPGALETVAECRRRGMKIGSTTGYTREMTEVLQVEAKKRGYEPDSTVCASDVPEARPAPWMSLLSAQQMGVYPLEAIVKVDDTIPGIDEGLNAGMWTVALAKSGNELGLNEQEIAALAPEELQSRLTRAYARMNQAGAHYVIDGIWELPRILDAINERLARGERP
ncbi:MAG: phosphonoacetaldehyde hydrolase [Ardenticatenales bacterium]|nr:phosphonoacetaldehyde hydrolase [Ardenticatenales bacterium]